MYNTQPENLSVHSFECAVLVHLLANIGNSHFNKSYDSDKLAAYALFHDATEVLTGDLPTPIKYFNDGLKASYKELENIAAERLLGHLPEDLSHIYERYFTLSGLEPDERRLIKAADRLCAYIKSILELNAGNREFSAAHRSIKDSVNRIECEEVGFFVKFYLDAFSLSLHEINGVL